MVDVVEKGRGSKSAGTVPIVSLSRWEGSKGAFFFYTPTFKSKGYMSEQQARQGIAKRFGPSAEIVKGDKTYANAPGATEPTAPKSQRAEQKTPSVDKATSKAAKAASKETTKGKAAKVTISKATSKGKNTPTPTATKPAKDRRASFYLDDAQIDTFRATFKQNKAIPIPYNSGAYRAFLVSLVKLGTNKGHTFKAVKDTMKGIMSADETKVDGKTQWQRFINKPGHSTVDDNCANVDQKIHQNAEVLQRLGGNTPYGMKLLQIGKVLKTKGVVVDVLKGKDGGKTYRLNTNAGAPTNEFKRQRAAE
jgi:hypothetical protein